MEPNNDNNNTEYRVGVFFGLVAGVLVLALTAMAFYALQSRPETSMAWNISAPEPSTIMVPSLDT